MLDVKEALGVAERVLVTADGRDKVGKAVQYACRIRVWQLLRALSMHTKDGDDDDDDRRTADALTHAASVLSNARRVYRLGKFVGETRALLDWNEEQKGQQKKEKRRMADAALLVYYLANIGSSLFDDLNFLIIFDIGSQRFSERMGRWADRCWWLAIGYDICFLASAMRRLSRKREFSARHPATVSAKDVREMDWAMGIHRVGMAKLVCDWVYCTINVFQVQDSLKIVSLVSAFLAAFFGSWKAVLKEVK